MSTTPNNDAEINDPPRPKLNIASEKTQMSFTQKMRQLGRKEMEKQTEEKAAKIGFPYVSLEKFPISAEALMSIPREIAHKNRVVSFLNLGAEVRIGSPDPHSSGVQTVLDLLKSNNPNLHIQVYLISEESLTKALLLYELLPEPKPTVRGVSISEVDFKKFSSEVSSFKQIEEEMKKVSITDLVTYIIASAIQSRASDIHVEAEEKDIKVRYRIDGVLQDVASLQKTVWKRLDSRIKLLAGLKLNITVTPQDGRFSIQLSNERIDVRVSTLPTNFGESIVMRLLMSSAVGLTFKNLGFSDYAYSILSKEIKRPNGMIITTGPTGSGKTTTLYAIINELNKPGVKIITIEDPIEYQLKGINQSQVDYEKGFTFATGLKSMLRQDPDVIMVGEIRDFDTAEIAIQAALTGHLVISTLHTNSSAGAIPRFMSMGTKPYLLAPALNMIIAQRLVRKICQNCKQPYAPKKEELTRAIESLQKLLVSSKALTNSGKIFDLNALTFFTSSGCEKCKGLGYKGRIGIYEIFTLSPEMEKIILSGEVSEYDMKKIAIDTGMVTMVQDGLLKALDGITSLEEVFRVAD